MKQRTILIRVQVDADKYEGQTDKEIMERLFQGNSLAGGASADAITPQKVDAEEWIPLKRLLDAKRISNISNHAHLY